MLCKAWCLHQAAKACLPLESRCLDLERLECWPDTECEPDQQPSASQVERASAEGSQDFKAAQGQQWAAQDQSFIRGHLHAFSNQWCAILGQLLSQAQSADQLQEADHASLLDALDGRLWHFTACCVHNSRPVGLPADAIQSAQLMMSAICQLAGIPTIDSSITATDRPSTPSAGNSSLQWTVISNRSSLHHSIQGNTLVDAFLGPQASVAEPDSDSAPAAVQLAAFDEAYHWHTGRPIEPTYLGETAESKTLAIWKDASLIQMAHCPLLPAGRRARLQDTISMCSNLQLIAKASERAERLARALVLAHSWLETKLQRQNQAQATFMRNYAASMMSTTYQGPGNAVAGGNGKAGRCTILKSKKAPKLSKADLIRQQQTAKRAAEGAVKTADKWQVKRQDLEQRAQLAGWDAQLQSEVDSFLQDCKPDAASAYLEASVFKLQHSLDAWKQSCLSRRHKRGPTAAAVAAAASTESTSAAQTDSLGLSMAKQAAMPHAVSIWMTVHDLIAKGHLSAVASPDRERAKDAAKLCELALQLLGFTQAAASASSLLKAFHSSKPAKKGKHSKQPAAVACEAAAAATAAAAPSLANAATSKTTATAAPSLAAAATSETTAAAAPSLVTAATAATSETTAAEVGSTACQIRASGVDTAGKSSRATHAGSTTTFGLGMSEACFQLHCCGDLLQRDVPAQPDPRVLTFNPDLWQRKVLDAIDADASSVICAPTSSGKTFISSYCMDKVLRQSQDGIVVFVAPTKALVNQTAAQVSRTCLNVSQNPIYPAAVLLCLHTGWTCHDVVSISECQCLPACKRQLVRCSMRCHVDLLAGMPCWCAPLLCTLLTVPPWFFSCSSHLPESKDKLGYASATAFAWTSLDVLHVGPKGLQQGGQGSLWRLHPGLQNQCFASACAGDGASLPGDSALLPCTQRLGEEAALRHF